MKNAFLLITLLFSSIISSAQIEVRESIYIRVDKLEPNQISFHISNGKILGLNIYIKNKYESQTGFATGYFDSNLTLNQKHKLDPSKVITYDQFVELINKDILNVHYYYRIYFIISEAKYDYLTIQVRQIMPPEFNQE
ncbi:hypothetical protein [Pedobacter cryophilus]|uniref:Uncharacterized protein n=1 Tax=Pedobacter cryophilus TaxID=2571271 RepID=A0A4U1BW70_9SPHI|nr:hypothetical protein [Pedobacter cryophilus]TKB95537.1 hypothetical protein FA046_16175 [Pedobacter cryophilus]